MTTRSAFASDALAGKVAIVTEAAGGIGQAIVDAFRGAGARVVATDLAAPGEEAGNDLLPLAHDVSSAADWARVTGEAVARFGRLDVLVNCAGLFRPASIAEETAEGFLRTVQANQIGVFLGMQAALAPMKAAGAGLYGNPGTVSYAASKFAVRGMTKVAAIEFAAFGIRREKLQYRCRIYLRWRHKRLTGKAGKPGDVLPWACLTGKLRFSPA